MEKDLKTADRMRGLSRLLRIQIDQFIYVRVSAKMTKVWKLCLIGYGFISVFWSAPMVIILRALHPLIPTKIARFEPQAIGVIVPQVFLYNLIVKSNAPYDICYYKNFPVSNTFWDLLTRRNLRIWPRWFVYPLDLWNSLIPGGEIMVRQVQDIDLFGSSFLMNRKLAFTGEEDQLATRWLLKKGWQPEQKFVCLIVRDSSYKPGPNNYRNSEIEYFLPACEWLASQGVIVIRMGKKMEKRLHSNSKNIIDYAFDQEKSDFLDVWLFANCCLTISTGTGPDIITSLYKRDVLLVNFLHLSYIWSWANVTVAPKKIYWHNTGKMLNLTEYISLIRLEKNYNETEALSTVRTTSLTSKEILDIVKQKWSEMQNKEVGGNQNNELLESLRIIEKDSLYKTHHHWINADCKISPVFKTILKDYHTERNEE